MIYDGFMFFNELELLEIRLHELSEVVDRFILVESPVTLSGKPKPLYYADAKDEPRFAPFLSRIEHVVVDHPTDAGAHASWEREFAQRRAISRGLKNFSPGDILIVSDADEIPRAEAVRRYDPAMGCCCLDLSLHFFWVNAISGGWPGPRIMPYEIANGADFQQIRCRADGHVPNGGWHFTYLGGAERVKMKLASFAHTELDTPEYMARVEESVRDAKLIWDASAKCTFVPIDDTFPKYLVDNQDRFSHLIKPMESV